MSDEHGRLEYTPAKIPSGLTTAAIRGCCLCGEMISGMGGGGDYIHKKCWNKLWSGEVAGLEATIAELREAARVACDANKYCGEEMDALAALLEQEKGE